MLSMQTTYELSKSTCSLIIDIALNCNTYIYFTYPYYNIRYTLTIIKFNYYFLYCVI